MICPSCGTELSVEQEVFGKDKLFTGHSCRGTVKDGDKLVQSFRQKEERSAQIYLLFSLTLPLVSLVTVTGRES